MTVLATVLAERLNLRRKPSRSAEVITILSFGTEVHILQQFNQTWSRVQIGKIFGFTATKYLNIVEKHEAVVDTDRLNFRVAPNLSARILGVLVHGTQVEILETINDDWVKIRVQERIGFVASQFLKFASTPLPVIKQTLRNNDDPIRVEVTTDRLRVRSGPGTVFPIIDIVSRGTVLEVLSDEGNWLQIQHNNRDGFVAEWFTRRTEKSFLENGLLIENPDIRSMSPFPTHFIARQTPRTQRAVVERVWNFYGGMLTQLSNLCNIPLATMVAVMGIESAGRPFGQDGRLIIRFENHIFHDQWGKDHPETYSQHFQFDQSERSQRWKNHTWRPNLTSAFRSFHGKQEQEWKVFQFAQSLDQSAALMSISMGLPQIMGFNHKRIGYDTVEQMYTLFNRSDRFQVIGLFDFIKGQNTTSPTLQALQEGDFLEFAKRYNGTANATAYQRLMIEYIQLYEQLITTARPTINPTP